MSDNTSTQRDMVILFGLGLVVGAAAGLLLAPASGEKTRQRIGDLVGEATGRAREGIDTAGSTLREQSTRLAHALKEGKEAFQEGLKQG